MINITAQDFNCIGNIAKHCDLPKLCIAIDEAKHFDLVPLFCFDFLNSIINSEESTPEITTLINGGEFVNCNGKTEYCHGVKRVWVYFAYARYLLINRLNDTPNGVVGKINEWSVPTPIQEVTDFSNKYRRMGKEAFKSVEKYLCTNKEHFPKFNAKTCKDCGCDDCEDGQTKKLTGVNFTMIKR